MVVTHLLQPRILSSLGTQALLEAQGGEKGPPRGAEVLPEDALWANPGKTISSPTTLFTVLSAEEKYVVQLGSVDLNAAGRLCHLCVAPFHCQTYKGVTVTKGHGFIQAHTHVLSFFV